MGEPFFSVVIPAHNEEGYIVQTLERLRDLHYPKDRYEIIVAENASTDNTRAVAKSFAESTNDLSVQVLSVPEASVSKARNKGAEHARVDADWVLFLDADTLLDPLFFDSLAQFLRTRASHTYAAGSVWLQPTPPTLPMRTVYGCINVAFMVSRAAYGGALLVRREVLTKVSFDEGLQVGEDSAFIAEAKKHGKFFFFRTKLAHTSTRRFQNGGWKKMPVWASMWAFGMIAPYHASRTSTIHRRFKYKVIR